MSDFNLKGKRIWVAGHTGMVGSALMRRLATEDCLLLSATHGALDLTRQADVEDWVHENKPDLVFLAAAKVGGIVANRDFPADFSYINQAIQSNVIQASFDSGVEKLVFLGSACMYPRTAPQPMSEDQMMTGPLEPTNEAYAVAKIAGMQLCRSIRLQHGRDFITVLPTNSYGPCDNYDPVTSHVPAALMFKCHQAKLAGAGFIDVWGSGKPTRDFLHVDDMADALILVARCYSDDAPINIGSGLETSIHALAEAISAAVGFKGELRFDAGKPDGAPRKILDNSKLNALGWEPKHTLQSGMKHAYDWFLENVAAGHR